MTIPRLFYPVLSRSLFVLIISFVLTACSSEDNAADSTLNTGTGVASGATPEPAPPPVPVADLSASPSSIVRGQSAILSWNSSDTTGCTASGAWSGDRYISGSETVSPAVTSTYTLTCNGDGGSISDSVAVTVTVSEAPAPAPVVPVVNLSVFPSSIDRGQSATLRWSSSNATYCTVSGAWGGIRNTGGFESVSPAVTSTYILTCSGAGGSTSDSVTVTVNEPPPPVPVVNLSVSSSSIEQGQSATLSWSSSNASSCTASGGWSGARSTTGSRIVSPAATVNYILTCNGAGGSVSDSVSVAVTAPPPPVPVVNLSVSSSSIEQGQSATLSWSSTNASSCTATGGWSGARSTTGSRIVSPAATVNYILTCNGAGGSISDSVTVTVNEATAPVVPVVNLSVSPSNIDQGQSATLSWSSSNVADCTVSGAWSGNRYTSGSETVSPAVTSTYIINCNGAGGSVSDTTPVSDSVTVTVNQSPAPVVPVVNLSVSPSNIDQGQSATLSWSSSNVAGCTVSGAWSGNRNTSGSEIVTPAVTSTYTLTCNGVDGSTSDSVTVTVNEQSSSQDISLSWVAPVEREDGTPISMSEIAGYRVYYGTSQGNYTNEVDIADSNTMQVTLRNLAKGTYYIVVTSYDMDGRESSFSQVVTRSI